MKTLLKNAALTVAGVLSVISLFAGTHSVQAATTANTPSVFDTILSSPLNPADTQMSIKSNLTAQGVTISGYQCFTIDVNTPSLEYLCGTLSGTTVTGLTRNLNGVTATTTSSGTAPTHRVGADVRVSDFPVLTILSNIIAGLDSISNPVYYDATVATSTIANNRQNLADWGLVQDTALQGSGAIAATTAAKGYVQLATQAQAAASTALGGGSSGASLVIATNIATSTFNAATAANRVVVTGVSGTIDQGFISLASTTVIGSTQAFSIGKNEFVATSSTTFVLPSGITRFFIRLSAAGGAGGGNAGGGGGAGGYAEGMVSTTTTMTLTVGAGVSSGTGGTTTLGGVITCTGGVTGTSNSNTNTGSSAAGGAGGTCTGGQNTSTGQIGSQGIFGNTGGITAPGVGGASPMGMYGSGANGGGNTSQPGEIEIFY